MSEKDKETTTEEGATETEKNRKEADSVIEVRHVYETATKESTAVKDEEPTVKPEKTDVTSKGETTTETGEKPEKVEKDETPQPTLKEVQNQLEAEKKKREELELIVEAEATKQFETEKTDFLALIPDEEERTKLGDKIGDSPDALAEYKRMSSFLTTMLEKAGVKVTGKQEIESTEEGSTEEGAGAGEGSTETTEDDNKPQDETVAGRAEMPEKTESEGIANNYKEYVDTLYEILKDPTKTAKEKKIADDQVNALFREVMKGVKGRGASNKDMPYLPATSSCPKCGKQLFGDLENCPHCEWKHKGY